MKILDPLLVALTSWASAFELVIDRNNAWDAISSGTSTPIDISKLRNNRGFGMRPGDANFDGTGASYPAQYLPSENFTYNGINYIFPQYQKSSGNDNVLARGQVLSIPQGRYIGVHMLAAAESSIATGSLTASYVDKSTTSGPLLVDPFWAWPYPYGGNIIFPYYQTSRRIDYNRSMIFETVNWLDSTKELVSLQLPNIRSSSSRLHIFAISLVPAVGDGLALDVEFVQSTNAWLEGTNKTQIIEATVNNVGTEWVLGNQTVRLTVNAPEVQTVVPGVINRLRPGDQAKIQIGVVNKDGVLEGSTGTATLVIVGDGVSMNATFNATFGIKDYDATFNSTNAHQSPPWYNNAKYGIFIHWGVYSVPGWGNSGSRENYAEWYWWDMNQGPDFSSQTYQYNLRTYGQQHAYDDFVVNFTASAFNPKDWVNLFVDAGAQYFVQVSKHHDGYALFGLPANVSQRTSVALPPHRNLVQELFAAAEQYQPQLHRGTYFSLPEWFNPAYEPLGFGSWPGGNATNPYTGQPLPYTGYVAVDDYVADVILPSMQTLAALGTEIMWCDIGGPNLTVPFAAEFFNAAAREGRQVALNNRCGVPGDFDTPEYARYGVAIPRKWESNLGLDPFSYGYNRATADAAYLSPQGIVTSLLDIVSKNGNFLLDIGPTGNGTIIDVEQRNLRAAGAWIRAHAEAIFNTTYWYVTPEEGAAVRFTQTPAAFYIAALDAPNATLVLRSPVPYVPGDNVTVVGGAMAGATVPSRLLADGSLELTLGAAVRSADEYAWVFKISYE